MEKTIQELHQAAQYLAAAGISFLEKKSDDSHTNIGWNSNENRMESHVFGNKDQLSINLNSIKLEWLKNGIATNSIALNSKSHAGIVLWVSEQATLNNIDKDFVYNFHYELPYIETSKDFKFSLTAKNLKLIANEFTKAQNIFEQFLEEQQLNSPIRIWPHHFDLGIYTNLATENTFMGAGLAIPDSLVDDFYFYASGYKNGDGIETKSFDTKNIGEWRSDWNGATIPSSMTSRDNALAFLIEAKMKFIQ